MKLMDKVAVVTGGQAGLGRMITLRFGEEGAQVVIPDVSLEGAQKVAKQTGNREDKILLNFLQL